MQKKHQFVTAATLLAIFVSLFGCSYFRLSPADYPVHTYHQPADLVYLTALETLNLEEKWVFLPTDKTKGVIEVRNSDYANVFGGDRQYARFLIKRVSNLDTSVELDPANSDCRRNDCLKLLEHINDRISRLPERPKPEQAETADQPSQAVPS